MNFKKILLLPATLLALGLSGCGSLGIGPNAKYYLTTTSYNYDARYVSYMLEFNGNELGGGYGGGKCVTQLQLGPQHITWKDTNTGEVHTAKNQVILTKDMLKDKHYFIAHVYSDDTVEVVTTNDYPKETERGIKDLNETKELRKRGGK